MRVIAGEGDWYNYACYVNGFLMHRVCLADESRGFVEYIQIDSRGKPEPGNGGSYRTAILYGKVELVHLPTMRREQERRQLKFGFAKEKDEDIIFRS